MTTRPDRCAYCHEDLPGRVRYFCMKHWDALPAKERRAVSRMHHHDEDLTTKIAKCVRILTEQKEPKL